MKSDILSQRTSWPLQKNSLIDKLEQMRSREESIIDLTESNPTQCGLNYPQEGILGALSKNENLAYHPDPRGMLKAREAVCQYYHENDVAITPDQVFLTACTSEAYSHLFRLLVESEENILLPRPSYPLFQYLADLDNVQAHYYDLNLNDRWSVDFANLRSKFTRETKAVVTVNPNNPTGNFISPQEAEQLYDMCENRQIPLISDEVFFDFYTDPSVERVSMADQSRILSFTLGGISKSLALPQMKVSWIIVSGPPEIRENVLERLEVIADTYLSVNTPSLNALPEWLNLREIIQGQMRDRLRYNQGALKEKFKGVESVRCLSTEGGWYAVMSLPPDKSEEQWSELFLTQERVFVHPGYFFDFPTEPYIVLSLLTKADVFQEGIGRIAERVRGKG